MNKKKATGCAANAAGGGITTPSYGSHHNTGISCAQGQLVAPLLKYGEENSITTEELLLLTGFHSARELRAQVRRERENGQLILSTVRGNGGYFLPAAGEQGFREIEAFISTVRSRAVHSLAILSAARRALRNLEGQFAFLPTQNRW